MPTRPTSHSYEVILDSVADGVFTVDRQWRITTFNASAERITGVPRCDAIGRKCWEVFHADICERTCVLKQTMSTGKTIVNRPVRIVNTDGQTVPISISTALLKNKSGAIVGGVETFRDLSEVEELRRELLDKHTFGDIVTSDHRMLRLFDTLPAMAQSEGTVLILGDSGTGKELFARAIHHASGRKNGPFVAVNCGALPENLLESELFGYRKGAFTDAKTDKPGRFDLARGGTLFLDEIGDLSKAVQVKLLRVLQERVYEPLGGRVPVTADVRIIAATNQNIESLVQKGLFRKDLFYRINVLTIRLPSLSQRKGDIPLLVQHFLAKQNAAQGKSILEVSSDAMAVLLRHDYPGNVRELENIIQHATILCTGTSIEPENLPESLHSAPRPLPSSQDALLSFDEFEGQRIKALLVETGFNKGETARRLGIHPTTLWRKMKRYGLS